MSDLIYSLCCCRGGFYGFKPVPFQASEYHHVVDWPPTGPYAPADPHVTFNGWTGTSDFKAGDLVKVKVTNGYYLGIFGERPDDYLDYVSDTVPVCRTFLCTGDVTGSGPPIAGPSDVWGGVPATADPHWTEVSFLQGNGPPPYDGPRLHESFFNAQVGDDTAYGPGLLAALIFQGKFYGIPPSGTSLVIPPPPIIFAGQMVSYDDGPNELGQRGYPRLIRALTDIDTGLNEAPEANGWEKWQDLLQVSQQSFAALFRYLPLDKNSPFKYRKWTETNDVFLSQPVVADGYANMSSSTIQYTADGASVSASTTLNAPEIIPRRLSRWPNPDFDNGLAAISGGPTASWCSDISITDTVMKVEWGVRAVVVHSDGIVLFYTSRVVGRMIQTIAVSDPD